MANPKPLSRTNTTHSSGSGRRRVDSTAPSEPPSTATPPRSSADSARHRQRVSLAGPEAAALALALEDDLDYIEPPSAQAPPPPLSRAKSSSVTRGRKSMTAPAPPPVAPPPVVPALEEKADDGGMFSDSSSLSSLPDSPKNTESPAKARAKVLPPSQPDILPANEVSPGERKVETKEDKVEHPAATPQTQPSVSRPVRRATLKLSTAPSLVAPLIDADADMGDQLSVGADVGSGPNGKENGVSEGDKKAMVVEGATGEREMVGASRKRKVEENKVRKRAAGSSDAKEEEDEEETPKRPKKTLKPSVRSSARKKIVVSSEEESDQKVETEKPKKLEEEGKQEAVKTLKVLKEEEVKEVEGQEAAALVAKPEEVNSAKGIGKDKVKMKGAKKQPAVSARRASIRSIAPHDDEDEHVAILAPSSTPLPAVTPVTTTKAPTSATIPTAAAPTSAPTQPTPKAAQPTPSTNASSPLTIAPPTKTPSNAVRPTKTPSISSGPTKTPYASSGPTKTPSTTSGPTKTPSAGAGPTNTPSSILPPKSPAPKPSGSPQYAKTQSQSARKSRPSSPSAATDSTNALFLPPKNKQGKLRPKAVAKLDPSAGTGTPDVASVGMTPKSKAPGGASSQPGTAGKKTVASDVGRAAASGTPGTSGTPKPKVVPPKEQSKSLLGSTLATLQAGRTSAVAAGKDGKKTGKKEEGEVKAPRARKGMWDDEWQMDPKELKQFEESREEREAARKLRDAYSSNPLNLQEGQDAFRADTESQEQVIYDYSKSVVGENLPSKVLAGFLGY